MSSPAHSLQQTCSLPESGCVSAAAARLITWGTKRRTKRGTPAEGGEGAKLHPVLFEAGEEFFQLHLGGRHRLSSKRRRALSGSATRVHGPIEAERVAAKKEEHGSAPCGRRPVDLLQPLRAGEIILRGRGFQSAVAQIALVVIEGREQRLIVTLRSSKAEIFFLKQPTTITIISGAKSRSFSRHLVERQQPEGVRLSSEYMHHIPGRPALMRGSSPSSASRARTRSRSHLQRGVQHSGEHNRSSTTSVFRVGAAG